MRTASLSRSDSTAYTTALPIGTYFWVYHGALHHKRSLWRREDGECRLIIGANGDTDRPKTGRLTTWVENVQFEPLAEDDQLRLEALYALDGGAFYAVLKELAQKEARDEPAR